jgi:tRNA threonylcarbamoyladenosine biosynthesis protein TsaB
VVSTEKFMHASHLTTFIQESLTQSGVNVKELDYVVLSDGPGSYTSLRVGAATAKGLCVALPGLAFKEIATLKSLAYGARSVVEELGVTHTIATIASRRDEVYAQSFKHWEAPVDALRSEILTPSSFAELREEGSLLIVGSGAEKVRSILGEADDLHYRPDLTCCAANLVGPFQAWLATGADPVNVAAYEPTYLKPPFVTKSTKKLL